MKLLTKEQEESFENLKSCCILKEKFENKYVKDKKYRKVKDCCLGNVEVLRMSYAI